MNFFFQDKIQEIKDNLKNIFKQYIDSIHNDNLEI